jgi:hypothetical protein
LEQRNLYKPKKKKFGNTSIDLRRHGEELELSVR